jgi:hypothetical protein
MPCVGFDPATPASDRAKTVHTLDRAATVTGLMLLLSDENKGVLVIRQKENVDVTTKFPVEEVTAHVYTSMYLEHDTSFSGWIIHLSQSQSV